MPPAIETIFAALDATWPAARTHRCGPWLVREGRGGGQRVSAATALTPEAAEDLAITRMERAQAALGQPPLVMVRHGEARLDAALAARGYAVVDPVLAYCAPVAALAAELPHLTAFAIWPPLAIQTEIWAAGGIGPSRLAVMARTHGPKTALIARAQDRPAGCAFVALDDKIAMLHALEVAPARRRQKAAVNMMRAAATWAQDHGASWLTLMVTEANAGARALYASLGMDVVGNYHYRRGP